MPTSSLPLFENRDEAASLYETLSPHLANLGQYRVEEKKTSLHIVAGRAAFLGVHPRRDGLRLNVVLGRKLEGSRVVKAEQVSAKTFHNEIDVRSPAELDPELLGWLKEAYGRVTGQ